MNNLGTISIVEAKLYHYAITDCQDPQNTKEFTFKVEPFKADINLEDKKIRLRSHIRIDAIQKVIKANHGIYLDSHVEVIFSYEDINLVKNINGKDSIDKEVHLELSSIAYSTIRGLICGYSKGTLFHDAYLPIYNPSNLVG